MATNGFKQGPWSLADLFPALDSPALQRTRDELEAQVKAFEALRPQLSADMPQESLAQALRHYERILRLLYRLTSFGSLSFAADTQDQAAQTYLAQARQLAAEVDNRTMFFKLWWKHLEDQAAARLMEAAGDDRYFLEALRLEKPYTLSEPEERVINLKNVNGIQALITLYDSITNRYTFRLEVEGEVRELTRGELSVYVRHPDPELRSAAYQELLRVYETDAPVLSQIYQARVRDWRSEQVDLRGFASPIAARNLANDIPDEVTDTLLEVCRGNAPLFQRFFKLKARWLGVDRLRRYDLYAPMARTEKEIPFEEGVSLVLDSFRRFEPRVAELARRVLAEGHMDSEVRKGKRSGAFCATVTPDLTPWVLLSYQSRVDDVATMAHELGHAVHSLLAAHHSALTQHPSLPLAETASTFGEMLLVDRLLEQDPDAELQRALLFRQMDDAYATIQRQAFFALFERQAHELIHQGASVDDLSQAYLKNLEEQFGDSMELSEDFRNEWLAIPHFYHVPFYVYAYAFGQLLVLALYQQYRVEGETFKPRYLEILAAGGSDSPMRVLERAGIDARASGFWQGGFDVLAGALERLEALPIPD